MLRYRLRSSWSESIQYEILARLTPSFRLEGVTMEMFDAEKIDTLVVSQAFQITAWTQFEGAEMPQSAVLRSEAFRTPSGAAETNAFTAWYERESLVAISAESNLNEDRFRLRPGLGVVDQRVGLSFVVGERRFVLDGTVYEAKEPLDEHPGDRLPDIVSSARTFAPRPAPPLVGKSVGVAGPPMWRILLGGASICAAAGVLVWYFRRHRRAASE